MTFAVKVFVIPASGLAGTPPIPGKPIEIEAPGLDAARTEAARRLVEAGYQVRAVSFAATGLVAYVVER